MRSASPRRFAAPVSGSVRAQRRIAELSPSRRARTATSTPTLPPTTASTRGAAGSGPRPALREAGRQAASTTNPAPMNAPRRLSAGAATSSASGSDSQKASPPPAAATASAPAAATSTTRPRSGNMGPVSGRDRTEDWTFGGSWPFEARWFDADGGRVHYVDEGPRDGTPVVMLHGNPAWSYLYRRFIAELTAAGHRAIALDLLGFGRSDKPADEAAYSVVRHAGRVGPLLDTLDLRDACLVVHDRLDGDVRRAYRAPYPNAVSRTGALAFPRQVPLTPD